MQTCINESVEYLIEIMKVIDDKRWMANNLLNHKEAVHKGISTFNNYEANKTIDLNIDKEDEDKDKLIPDKNNSVNDFLNHYNSSEICNKEWGALGSIQLYELPSVQERQTLLKKAELCFRCGAKFHGPFNDNRKSNPCNWDLKLKVAKCIEKTCLLSTDTCFNHNNKASSDLINWLKKGNVKFSFNAIFNKTVKHSDTIPSTDINKELRYKLQEGKANLPLSNDQILKIFDQDPGGNIVEYSTINIVTRKGLQTLSFSRKKFPPELCLF